MSEPSVSVIVPTYNRPGFLARALASIRSQTYQDYEIIVVNDGGKGVMRLCDLFGKVINLRHGENQGLPAARNTGIQAAQGWLIAYLDDDDLWLPGHLSKLVGLMMISDCRLVYSDSYFWQDEREFRLLLSEDYSKQNLLGQNLTPCCSILHDKELFDQAGYFDESLPNHEDYDMWLRMSEFTDFEHLPEVTALYSKRSGSDQMSMDLLFMASQRDELQASHRERIKA